MAVTAVSPGTDRAPLRSDLLSCDTRILESLLEARILRALAFEEHAWLQSLKVLRCFVV